MASRTRYVAACALFGWGVIVLAQSDDDVLPGVVIEDVTVVSPERRVPLDHAFVHMFDGRIAQVSTQQLVAERRIDGRGRFLVPGLIDTHVHLGGVPGMQMEHEQRHPELVVAFEAQKPRSYLYFGFTTVIDLFGNANGNDEWNAIQIRPDAYFCGGAPTANGYPMVFSPEEVRFRAARYFLYDEQQDSEIPDYVDPEQHTPEAVVNRMTSDGAICVKTHHETGFGELRDLPTPSLETIRALVEAAHAEGLPVILHANSKSAQRFAVEAGVDIIAHGLWNGLSRDSIALTDDENALLDAIAASSIGYQPTFQVLHGESDLFDSTYLDDPELVHAYPEELIEWYGTEEAGWFREQMDPAMSGEEAAEIYAPILERLELVVSRLSNAEARLLFGSDTPSGPTYANPPGLNGLIEMRRWIDAGVSETQLFNALTLENARAFGLDDEIGTVETGKKAHLLLLGENPLDGVEAYDTIELVILDGVPIERDKLSALNSADQDRDDASGIGAVR
jgi:imidazolonepropionase-like amidohydrolase